MKNFLIELSIIHLVLVIAYWFLLRKEYRYGHQRFYLIFATLLSVVIPFLKLPKLFPTQQVTAAAPTITFNPTDAVVATPISVQSFWYDKILLIIYLSVTAMFMCRFLFNLMKLIYLEHKSDLEYFNGYAIRRTNYDLVSFTFFNWIFLNRNISKDQDEFKVILKHEEAHASLMHTYDLILFELYTICFWWLPSAWFIQKEIKKIHEYQADAYVLKTLNIEHYSSILINSTLRSHGVRLASSFHDGLIIKRLNAMKQKTKKISTWKLGSLTTLFLMLFTLFACTEEKLIAQDLNESSSEKEVFTIVEEQPSYEGGMDAFYGYVMKEIRYPAQARKSGVEGQVSMQFDIERNGSVSNVSVIKDIGEGCGSEVKRVLNQVQSFKPGSQRGRTVKTIMGLPVNFNLDPSKTNTDGSPQGIISFGELQTIKQRFQLDVQYKDGSWHGTLQDNDHNPLPGANIIVDGTNYGRVSDLEGKFSIDAKESQDIVISYVGYESIKLADKDNVKE